MVSLSDSTIDDESDSTKNHGKNKQKFIFSTKTTNLKEEESTKFFTSTNRLINESNFDDELYPWIHSENRHLQNEQHQKPTPQTAKTQISKRRTAYCTEIAFYNVCVLNPRQLKHLANFSDPQSSIAQKDPKTA